MASLGIVISSAGPGVNNNLALPGLAAGCAFASELMHIADAHQVNRLRQCCQLLLNI